MEKFGIFELLDALAAITAQENQHRDPPSAQDSAYLPPSYPAQNTPEAPREEAQPAQSHPEKDALTGFYARHDAIAKKAGKK